MGHPMNHTQQLLRVYRVDQRIEGLQSRLKAAEQFLGNQERQLSKLSQRATSLESQLRQVRAVQADEEGEVERLSVRIADLKEQMNAAASNKEYQAFLSEVKNLETKRREHEDLALAHMEKAQEIETELQSSQSASEERTKVRDHAEGDRSARAQEIREKVEELKRERAELAAEVPADLLRTYEQLWKERGDEAMAPLEIVDHRRHEYICGSSMMSVPVEVANSLLRGQFTLSPNNGCILYLTEETAEAMAPAESRK